MRLDQFLVQANICSRSEAKKYVKMGRVSVNKVIFKDSSAHINEKSDEVCFDGNLVEYEKFHYYMLNKPAGCVSATKDRLSDTVLDLLKGEPVKDLFPVGRLDKDTEGLLLITDDGQLAHKLLSPRRHVDKVYYVVADRKLSEEAIDAIQNGMDIGDDKLTLPAKIKSLASDNLDFIIEHINETLGKQNIEYFEYELTIREGRFHQVKRMFEKCGSNVCYLKRISMGSLAIDDKLEAGEYRKLTSEEIDALQMVNTNV